jgi:hypothetical protein
VNWIGVKKKMFWPFKKKTHYPGNAAEAITILHNPYILRLFKDNPSIKGQIKNIIPGFDEYNLLHNMCAINLMFSFRIVELDLKMKQMEKYIHTHGQLK